jgi:hypothetical protein
VGIAENVHELIGAHESIPRYIKEIALQPLSPQDLIDIVKNAADKVGIAIRRDTLFRIAMIGSGYPHFAHLMGKAILVEAVIAEQERVTAEIYRRGVARAVRDSIQELKIAYETATQRREDCYKHLVWALADSDYIDIRTDDWIAIYERLATKNGWPRVPGDKLKTAISNLKRDNYGGVICNTPARYGKPETRYRYIRFKNMLMRGHVRLQAASEDIELGKLPGM